MYRTRSFTYLVASVFVALVVGCQSAAQSVSDQPDTPFKLATFEAGGETTVGLVLVSVEALPKNIGAGPRGRLISQLPRLKLHGDLAGQLQRWYVSMGFPSASFSAAQPAQLPRLSACCNASPKIRSASGSG